MAKREEIERRAEELLTPITLEHGFEVVDVEYVKEGSDYYLRAYIDKPGGITIDDCELVSRAFEAELDREDLIEDSYILEVSSPGLGRPLKKERDFARAVGQRIEIRLYKGSAQEKQQEGELIAYDPQTVTIRREDGTEQTFERSALALIRMALDF